MDFPIFIGQDYVEMESWSRFIYQASRGSIEAVETLNVTELTFVAEYVGKNTDDLDKIASEDLIMN